MTDRPMPLLAQLRTLLHYRRFRRLFAIRLVSQCGDGLFQVGLATLFFFSPQSMASAGGVAAAFAVLLLPFTVVGPFVGPLLDRWSRRQTLLAGNALRVLLTALLVLAMLSAGVGPLVYVLALVTLGVNRFLLSALSAGVPLVVPREHLLLANTLTPTLGAGSAVAGAVVGLVLGLAVPLGPGRDSLTLVVAALFFAGASALSLRLGRRELGPQPVQRRRARAAGSRILLAVADVVADMAAGARYLWQRRTPGLALGVLSVQRFCYGVNFLALILISRTVLADPSRPDQGMATFAVLTGFSFLGNAAALPLTPLARRRIALSRWIVVCLGLAAVSQLVAATTPTFAVLATSGVLLGLAMQGVKISVDTIVHRDTTDAMRGRTFALYDVLFNGSFVAAALLAAWLLPEEGWSRGVFLATSGVLLLLAAGYAWGVRAGDRPRPVPGVPLAPPLPQAPRSPES